VDDPTGALGKVARGWGAGVSNRTKSSNVVHVSPPTPGGDAGGDVSPGLAGDAPAVPIRPRSACCGLWWMRGGRKDAPAPLPSFASSSTLSPAPATGFVPESQKSRSSPLTGLFGDGMASRNGADAAVDAKLLPLWGVHEEKNMGTGMGAGGGAFTGVGLDGVGDGAVDRDRGGGGARGDELDLTALYMQVATARDARSAGAAEQSRIGVGDGGAGGASTGAPGRGSPGKLPPVDGLTLLGGRGGGEGLRGGVGNGALHPLLPAMGMPIRTPVTHIQQKQGRGREPLQPTPPQQPPSKAEFVKTARASGGIGSWGRSTGPHHQHHAGLPSPQASGNSVGGGGLVPLAPMTAHDAQRFRSMTLPLPASSIAPLPPLEAASGSAVAGTYFSPMPGERIDEAAGDKDDVNAIVDANVEEAEDAGRSVVPLSAPRGSDGTSLRQQQLERQQQEERERKRKEELGALALLDCVYESADFDENSGGGGGALYAVPAPEPEPCWEPQSSGPHAVAPPGFSFSVRDLFTTAPGTSAAEVPKPRASSAGSPHAVGAGGGASSGARRVGPFETSAAIDTGSASLATSSMSRGSGGGELTLARVPEADSSRASDGDGAAAESDSLQRAPSPSTFSAEDIARYGRHLGIDPVFEPDLLWIAEQALGAPLAPNWTERTTPEVGHGLRAQGLGSRVPRSHWWRVGWPVLSFQACYVCGILQA
jgi:hypothetical protein